jgi:hypothetical protein
VSQASKGIGYVTFKKASEAAKALEEICDSKFLREFYLKSNKK